MDCDHKLDIMDSSPLSSVIRLQLDCKVNDVDTKSIKSINGSIGSIGITISPICSFYSSILHQKIMDRKVSAIVSQCNYINILQHLGTLVKYCRLKRRIFLKISLVSLCPLMIKFIFAIDLNIAL